MGTTTITAVIDGISGTREVTVVAPTPPPSVSMGGPTSVRPNEQCYWWATASGGTPGYSYTWVGGLYGSPSGSEYYATTPSSGSFTVKVKVTDALGATATATKLVTVSSLAPVCPI